MEKELPKNWVFCPLDDLAKIQSGGTPARSNSSYWNGDIPWVKISDIKGLSVDRATEYITEKGLKNSSATIFPKGTILFTIFATIGRIGVLEIEATTNQAIAGITPSELINKKYITYSLLELSSSILSEGKGVAQKNINQTILKNTLIPLPPLPEQTRIVAKLDRLFGQLEQIKESLDKIPQFLKDFRQQVLTQAVTGKLTAEWRELNKEYTTSLKVEKNTNFYLHPIPNGWIHTTIDNIGKVKGGKRLPKGHDLVDEDTGLPYIRARDLKQGSVLTENLRYLLPETQEKIKRYTVKENDLYITIVGAKIGDAGIIPFEMDGANLTENAAKITDLEKGVDHDYLALWLQSSICFENMMQSIKSAAQGKLALTRIKELPVYIGSIEEQQEIVARIKNLFAKADAIEQQYQALKQKIDTLPQAILHKAFKGELVPQLESDGDARELLEEIKALKKQTAKPNTKKPKAYRVDDVELGRVAETGEKYKYKYKYKSTYNSN